MNHYVVFTCALFFSYSNIVLADVEKKSGLYFGASLGTTSYTDSSLSDHSQYLFIGKEISGYSRLEISKNNYSQPTFIDSNSKILLSIAGTEFAYLGSYEIDDKSLLLARLGLLSFEARTEIGNSIAYSDKSNAVTAGLSWQYNFTDSIAIRPGFDLFTARFELNRIPVEEGLMTFSIGMLVKI